MADPVATTGIEQKGYVDELSHEDPTEHFRIEDLLESEYVSHRYMENLTLFQEWIERKTS